jgi:Tfp pilus assembly protein FimT
MAINERLVHTASAAAGGGTGNQEEGLILHLDANDVDSYDGDGTEWVDIANHEYTPSTDVSEHFNTVIYNGNGSSSGQAITGVGFKPDLVWVKKRNATGRHQIQHSLEDGWGDSSDAIPYAPSQAHIDFRPVSTFDSDGFTIPTNYT